MADDQRHTQTRIPSRFIDGVFRFCDAWCERCRCQSRCRLYHERLRHEAQDRGEALSPEEDDVDPAGEWSPEWLAIFEEANRPPTDAEIEEAEKEHARIEAILDRDPLVCEARDYSEIVCGLRTGLDPLFKPPDDGILRAAMDVIGWHGVALGVKVRRACRDLIRTEDDDEEFLREDGNGTAKLVRVLVRESRDAWSALMQPGHAIGDGVPARMIARLDDIDAAMATRFPDAMAFVRPGLDD